MKRTTRAALRWLLVLCLTLGLFTPLGGTARAAEDVKYLDASGAEKTAASATAVAADSTSWSDGWYVVDTDVTIASRITVTGDVHLILADGAELTASAGITVTGSNSLTIYAQSTDETTMGKLSATGGQYQAGIGGNNNSAGGTITINGGTVTANGALSGAGIGGGNYSAGGTIEINGGTVTANGGITAAGIGGGYNGASGAITITDGTVNANGNVSGSSYNGGAGIGGGNAGVNGDNDKITIEGGTVTATVPNGTKGAAIGNGGGTTPGGILATDVPTITIDADLSVGASKNTNGAGAEVLPAEDVANNTDYKYVKIPLYKVSITAGEGMTKTTASGSESQTLSGTITNVVYTANEGYYFPEDYSVKSVNGISVTRDSYTQITVSGTPTASAEMTLTAATAKTKPAAPTTPSAANCTTSSNNDGKLTGVTTAMEYKKSDAESWTAGTDSDITGLVPGTYYVRVKATDTTLASDNQELTIKAFASFTVTFKVVNGSWDDDTTADKTVTLTGYEGDTLKLAADQIPAIGTKPNDTYKKAGSWDPTPSADTAITANTTYTYTYAQKDSITVTAPTANGLTYTGASQSLVTAGTASGGTLQYKIDSDGTYSEDLPTATNAGTYTVYYKAVGDGNHNDSAENSVTVTIAKADSAVTTAPAANGLTYTGAAQSLVTAGTASGGTLQYRIGTDATTVPTDGYDTAIPTGTDAGTYYVWYRVVGDEDHTDTSPACIAVSIAPRAATVTANAQTVNLNGAIDTAVSNASLSGAVEGHALSAVTLTGSSTANATTSGTIIPSEAKISSGETDVTANYAITYVNGVLTVSQGASGVTAPTAKELTYTGAAQELVTAGTASGGTLQYAAGTDGTTAPTDGYGTAIPTGTDAGTYYVWYRVAGDDDHQDSDSACVTVTIGKANITPTVTISDWTYGGTASSPSVEGNTGNGAVTYAYKVKDAADETYNSALPTDAGDYTIRATIAETDNYNSGTATADFSITTGAITPRVTLNGWTYGEYDEEEDAPTVSNYDGDGTITYAYKARSAEDEAYDSAVPVNAGEYTVRATIAATGNYAGGEVTANFTIRRRDVTVSGLRR